jgi:hypothetical protein
LAPEKYYELSDVIFVGRATNIDRNQPFDQAANVTFNVSKSWKGVDTKLVTIRTGDGTSCSSYHFEQDREYLVYGTRDLSSVDVTFCGGSASIDYSPFVSRDLTFLENNYTPLELEVGHIRSINLFPIITILGSLVAVSTAAFIILKRRS